MNREKTVWVGQPPAIEYLQKSKDKYERAYRRLKEISVALSMAIKVQHPERRKGIALDSAPWLGLNASWQTYIYFLDPEELEEKLKKIDAQRLSVWGKYEAARDMLYEATGTTPAAAAASEEYQ